MTRACSRPRHALQSSVAPAQDGSLRLNVPAGVQALFAAGPLQKYLHVGLTDLGGTQAGKPAATREITLLGVTDLPAPPASPPHRLHRRTPTPPPRSGPSGTTSFYAGHPVRVVALQSQVLDGRGRTFELLVQVAETTGPRDRAQAATLRQELIRDARMVLVMVLLVWLGVTWSLQPLERLRKSVLQSKGTELQPWTPATCRMKSRPWSTP